MSANVRILDENIVGEIEVAAPPERVFAALIDPAKLAAWWGSGVRKFHEKENPMRSVRKYLVLFMALVSLASVGWAASKNQPEFDKIKSLAGSWEGKGPDGGSVYLNYKVVSGGTAVMESITEGPGNQMLTLYYLDGDHLMMTHYCSAGNQPRMRAEDSGAGRASSSSRLSTPPTCPGPTPDTCTPTRSSGGMPTTSLSNGLGGRRGRRE